MSQPSRLYLMFAVHCPNGQIAGIKSAMCSGKRWNLTARRNCGWLHGRTQQPVVIRPMCSLSKRRCATLHFLPSWPFTSPLAWFICFFASSAASGWLEGRPLPRKKKGKDRCNWFNSPNKCLPRHGHSTESTHSLQGVQQSNQFMSSLLGMWRSRASFLWAHSAGRKWRAPGRIFGTSSLSFLQAKKGFVGLSLQGVQGWWWQGKYFLLRNFFWLNFTIESSIGEFIYEFILYFYFLFFLFSLNCLQDRRPLLWNRSPLL